MYNLFLEDGDLLESVELMETLNEGFLRKLRELITGKIKRKKKRIFLK